MAKKIATKTETPAIVTTINPPKGKVARTSVSSKPAKAAPKVAAMSEKDQAELKRLLEIQRASRGPVVNSRYGNTIVRLKDPNAGAVTNLPPQARIILTVLDNAKGGKMTFQELCDAMAKVWPRDRYRQEPSRIVTFYRQRLIEGKHIKCE